MRKRTFCGAVLGSMLVAPVRAQSPHPPETYSFVAASEMAGPMTVSVNRNGSKEVIEMKMTSGALHLRLLYDFQAHRIYTRDLLGNTCTTQEYASAYAPVMHDPIGGAPEMIKEMSAMSLKALRTENVNGVAAKMVESALPDGQGKYRMWLEEKFNFPVKQTITLGSKPERPLFEMRQLSYAPSPASLFTAPSECTRIGGVSAATGGRAEMKVDVKVQQTHDLGQAGAPAAPAGSAKVTAVRLRLVPESYTGPCPSRVQLVGDITTDGPGTVWYEFLAGAVRKGGPAEGTIKFDSAGTQTVTLNAEYVSTPRVGTSLIAVMADEQGRRGPQNLSSGPVKYNATCAAPAARR